MDLAVVPKHLVTHGAEGRQRSAIGSGDDGMRARPEGLQPTKRTVHAPHVATSNSSSSLCADVAHEVVLGRNGSGSKLGTGAAEQVVSKAGPLGSLASPLV
eukprot:614646-Alexandrium_andersonii.AAC.1